MSPTNRSDDRPGYLIVAALIVGAVLLITASFAFRAHSSTYRIIMGAGAAMELIGSAGMFIWLIRRRRDTHT